MQLSQLYHMEFKTELNLKNIFVVYPDFLHVLYKMEDNILDFIYS